MKIYKHTSRYIEVKSAEKKKNGNAQLNPTKQLKLEAEAPQKLAKNKIKHTLKPF